MKRLLVLVSFLLTLILAALVFIAFMLVYPTTFEERVPADAVANQLRDIVTDNTQYSSASVDSCVRREPREFLCLVSATTDDGDEVSLTYDVVCSRDVSCIYATCNVGLRNTG